MYPFLSGFWTCSGASAIILFVLLFLHDMMGVKSLSSDWLPGLLQYAVWAAPFVGLFRIYYNYFIYHRPESQAKTNRRLMGGVIGTALVLFAAYYILPYCRS